MCSSIHHSTFTSPTLPLLCSKEKISKLILSPVGLYKFTLEHLTLAWLPATECLWFWLLELSVLHVLYTRLPLSGSKVAISDWELSWAEVPKTLKALLSSVGLTHIYTRCSLCLRFLFFHYFFPPRFKSYSLNTKLLLLLLLLPQLQPQQKNKNKK